jgi:hypothetical protein
MRRFYPSYVDKAFAKSLSDLWSASRPQIDAATNLSIVAARYYTHFVTAADQIPWQADASEWSGVVELREPLQSAGGTRELCSLIAQSFDLNSEDIKILHWARLH